MICKTQLQTFVPKFRMSLCIFISHQTWEEKRMSATFAITIAKKVKLGYL